MARKRKSGVNRRRDYSDFVVKDGKHFYVDREDVKKNIEIAEPGDIIKFKWHKAKYKAIVTSKTVGRDDDAYKIKIMEKNGKPTGKEITYEDWA